MPQSVANIMNATPFSLHLEDRVEDPREFLRWSYLRSLPVVDDYDHLVGVVSARNLIHFLLSRENRGDIKIRDLMVQDFVTTSPDSSAESALETLLQSDAAHLYVLENGRLVGLLAETDLLRALKTSA